MIRHQFNALVKERIKVCLATLCRKSDEYSTEDVFHNFKVAATVQNCSPEYALGGMMAKHTVSVYDLIRKTNEGEEIPLELWDEKIGDSINYLLLLSALTKERYYESNTGSSDESSSNSDC